MNESALRVLCVGAAPPAADAGFGPFESTPCAIRDAATHVGHRSFDLILFDGSPAGWEGFVDAAAVVLVLQEAVPQATIAALRGGAQDVLTPAEAARPEAGLRLRAAVERHRLQVAARHAFATDVQTGLPHEGQLLEHMSHLLALREREPAPMALLVLRIEGFATTAARLGAEAAGALRRKVAVRLRAGVRASDVVASLGTEAFAVLLSSIEAPADALRVGAKLQAALAQPFKVAGSDTALATALGIAASPADGTQPAALLHRAFGLAASAQAVGRTGFANRVEGGGEAAANDE